VSKRARQRAALIGLEQTIALTNTTWKPSKGLAFPQRSADRRVAVALAPPPNEPRARPGRAPHGETEAYLLSAWLGPVGLQISLARNFD
jgi:hypothetical protein